MMITVQGTRVLVSSNQARALRSMRAGFRLVLDCLGGWHCYTDTMPQTPVAMATKRSLERSGLIKFVRQSSPMNGWSKEFWTLTAQGRRVAKKLPAKKRGKR